MPSILSPRTFATGGKGGSSAIARAKKAADLYIKSNTDASGNVNDPAVYQYVNNNILAPYADDISVQQKIAAYSNTVKKIQANAFDQDNTLGVFKANVNNALYASGNVIRDPAKMAMFSSNALDNILNQLDAAIQHGTETNKSINNLVEYRKEVAAMAGGQRDLLNNLNSGSNPQNLDGYGYFVKTNPVDGSLIGAALLPLNSAPAEVTKGTKRIDNQIGINGSKIPVYLPVTKDANGQLNAKLYGNTWSGSEGDATLSGANTPNFQNKDAFDIKDQTMFPIKKNTLAPGSFGSVVTGVKDNQTQYAYYYRGQDGKVRQLDQQGLDAFKQDPVFSSKLSYIPSLSPDEVQGLGSIDRLNPADVPKWSSHIQLDQATAARQAADQNLQSVNESTAQKTFDAVSGAANGVGSALGGALSGAARGVASFFSGRKNAPNKPDQAPQGDKTSYSAGDVVSKGKEIFAGGDNVA